MAASSSLRSLVCVDRIAIEGLTDGEIREGSGRVLVEVQE